MFRYLEESGRFFFLRDFRTLWNKITASYSHVKQRGKVTEWIPECYSSQPKARLNLEFELYVSHFSVWQPNLIYAKFQTQEKISSVNCVDGLKILFVRYNQ
jgi:hypothetical protein